MIKLAMALGVWSLSDNMSFWDSYRAVSKKTEACDNCKEITMKETCEWCSDTSNETE